MLRLLFIFSLFGFLTSSPLQAQSLDHVLGEVLIKFDSKANQQRFDHSLIKDRNLSSLKLTQTISNSFQIYKYSFDHTRQNELDVLAQIQSNPLVFAAQFNHLVKYRETIPNDPEFGSMWQYINTGQNGGTADADIDIELAWDITTGGVTSAGDTIVVAVMDSGLLPGTSDFGSNIWINKAEIPNNNIDDDQNGFIDDFQGWNFELNSNDIFSSRNHGTVCAGIVGAKGNDGNGIVGVNWDVKIMVVRNGDFGGNEAIILQSYDYVFNHRKAYNESNGAKGAFIVASNSSFGIDEATPAQYPLWCGIFDSLGSVGVLNACATANENYNVDVDGDIPTTCPSDYVIAVTSIGYTDQKPTRAAYGLEHIDLASYGDGVYGLRSATSYGDNFGTSFSTPHIAGLIGLMYAIDCPAFNAIYKQAPAQAAEIVKAAIMNSTVPISSLQGITVTGGKMNAYQAITELLVTCSTCPPPLSINFTQTELNTVQMEWENGGNLTGYDIRYKSEGESQWTEILDVDPADQSITISGLDVCANYTFEFRSHCAEGTTDYFAAVNYKTIGCCSSPDAEAEVTYVSDTEVRLEWSETLVATAYEFNYRLQNESEWMTKSASTNAVLLSNLTSCATYEYQIQAVCQDSSSIFSSIFSFTTTGCGVCTSANYCGVSDLNTDSEYIQEIKLGSYTYTSGDNDGYGDFTTFSLGTIYLDSTIEVHVIPEFTTIVYEDSYKIWIDFDHNGVFDSDEAILDITTEDVDAINNTYTIPSDALLGNTRMRVAMIAVNAAEPCTSAFYGEVEDYCVKIDKNSSVFNTFEKLGCLVTPNPVHINETLKVQIENQTFITWTMYDIHGKVVYENKTASEAFDIPTNNLTPGLYILGVRTNKGYATKEIIVLD